MAITLLCAPAVASAQDADSVRQQLRLPQPATFAVAARGSSIAPGMTIGIPSGYGADLGDAFVGVAFQLETRNFADPDGGVVAGFGLGDAQRAVGLELAVTSFGTVRSCCRGSVSAKLHRVMPGDLSLAVGVENGVVWGGTDAGTSFYGVGSKVFLLRRDPGSFLGALALTAGVGNGRFRTEDDIIDDRERINPFGSVGVRVAPRASAITSWTGQELAAGLSIVPFRNVPLFINPGVADLTSEPRLIFGVGYGFDYGTIF